MCDTVILDCYTDEPSGYGVRPYLGTHQIHLSQALNYKGVNHVYLTIDDLRYAYQNDSNVCAQNETDTDIDVFNTTLNCKNALEIIERASTIFIIMGCFVEYRYFSARPPKGDELYQYLKYVKGRIVLFYVLGGKNTLPKSYLKSGLYSIVNHTEIGNTYRYVLEESMDIQPPNYKLLSKISSFPSSIVDQLRYPIIAEIETGTGCNTPTCKFCVEARNRLKIVYREPHDIVAQIKQLYNEGVRHFRLGRQPNIYHYYWGDVTKFESLLNKIREECPDLEVLHIDNVNMVDVVGSHGVEYTKAIVRYCTSGNIAPFGIESFDCNVREATRITGTADDALKAISIINEYGGGLSSDGFSWLLPGVNLIHNLPGSSGQTHDINMRYLKKILDSGLMTRRLFYRNVTPNVGVSFNDGPKMGLDYDECLKDITEEYVLPMQARVFPEGTVLKGFREVVIHNGKTVLRTLGTCSIRLVLETSKELKPYGRYDVCVSGNDSFGIIKGRLM